MIDPFEMQAKSEILSYLMDTVWTDIRYDSIDSLKSFLMDNFGAPEFVVINCLNAARTYTNTLIGK